MTDLARLTAGLHVASLQSNQRLIGMLLTNKSAMDGILSRDLPQNGCKSMGFLRK
jgi:hypothetical protein